LQESDVRRADFGLVPFGEAKSQQGGLSFGKQSRLIDHRSQGQSGLLSLISVRYTVARRDAVEALDLAVAQLDHRRSGRDSTVAPLMGGDIADFNLAARTFQSRRPSWLTEKSSDGMLRNYGTDASRVLAVAEREPKLGRCFTGSHVSLAEAIYAVRTETAQRMGDIVFRRTELGTDGHPGAAALDELQTLLGQELGWSEQRSAEERTIVEREFERYLATPRSGATPQAGATPPTGATPATGTNSLQQARRA
jgi:glycerol-3-phosphate dehydrogenase